MTLLEEGKHRLAEWELPRPGQRILRSVCVVGLCFIVYFLSGKRGIPFYSVIAALQCMQPYHEKTLAVGKRRTVGTLMGAFWGLIVILTELYGFGGNMDGTLIWYLLIACCTCYRHISYQNFLIRITVNAAGWLYFRQHCTWNTKLRHDFLIPAQLMNVK